MSDYLQLMRVEKLKRLWPTGSGAAAPWEVMNFDRELLKVIDTAVDLADQGDEGRGDEVIQDTDGRRIGQLMEDFKIKNTNY